MESWRSEKARQVSKLCHRVLLRVLLCQECSGTRMSPIVVWAVCECTLENWFHIPMEGFLSQRLKFTIVLLK